MEKNAKKKKTLLIVGIVVAVLVVVYIICVATGNVRPAAEAESSSNTVSLTNIDLSDFGWDEAKSTKEKGSTERSDEILLKADSDVEKASEEQATALWEEGFNYLKQYQNNFYDSNEVMEKSMYYGQFIYRYVEKNAAANDISELADSTKAAYDAGYNTVKAIKYVYRGEEKVNDENTQNSLKDAQDALKKFK